MITTADIRYVDTRVTFLEMHTNPHIVLPARENVSFRQLPKPISAGTYRSYYYGVGAAFHWLDRMVMPDDELLSKINAPEISIFIMYVDNQPAGFAEFIIEKEYTEILYFGLLPAFVGKGWGAFFLNWTIRQAWSYQPKWIQLNTCQLDHPNALPVYKKAGFVETRAITEPRKVLSGSHR